MFFAKYGIVLALGAGAPLAVSAARSEDNDAAAVEATNFLAQVGAHRGRGGSASAGPGDGAPVASLSYDEDLGAGTLLRSDVLREYAKVAGGDFDIVQFDGFALHLTASDLAASLEYEEAKTEAFTLTGHFVQEASGVKYQISCPACYGKCQDDVCVVVGKDDVPEVADEQGSAEKDEGASVLAPRVEIRPSPRCLECGITKCFSSKSTVIVKDKGVSSIEDLRIGDMVLSDDRGTYSKVYSKGHNDEKALAQFVRISTDVTEITKMPLELTPGHMVFKASSALPVPASSIKVGDVVKTVRGPSKVTDVQKISRNGLFNPITLSGTIVVSDVVSSIHSEEEGFEGTEAGWFYLGGHKIIHWHKLMHSIHAPHRIICGRLATCVETPDEDGLPPFHQFLAALQDTAIKKDSTIFSALVLLAVVVFVVPFYMIELLLENPYVVFSGIFFVTGIWLVLSDVKMKVKSA